MVTCGMYDAAGDWVSAVGMPAKSGVGGGIVAVLPGQLGIGVYSPLLDAKGNSVRGVRVCRSLSEQLGLHFLTVSRDSRATLRAVYEPRDGIRVYETHGDLLFSGAEQVRAHRRPRARRHRRRDPRRVARRRHRRCRPGAAGGAWRRRCARRARTATSSTPTAS